MKRILHKLGRLWRARGGIAAVELALLLPLFPLMLFGTVEIGRMLFDYQAASKSVRDATRYLTRIDATDLGLTCPACAQDAECAGTIDGTATEVTNAKNLALTGSISGPGLPGSKPFLLAYWTNPTSVSVTATCIGNPGNVYQGFYFDVTSIPNIEVTATVAMPLMNGWLLGLGDTLNFTISHKEVHFGR